MSRYNTHKIPLYYGSGASSTIKSSVPIYQEAAGISQVAQVQVMGEESVLDKLPDDIFDHLYFLVPIDDAARAACVSHGFLRSWRRYPRLVFNTKTLGYEKLMQDAQHKKDEIESYFANKIDHVLKNRSGFGINELILQLFPCPDIDASYLDKWLQIAVKHGIEELALQLSILKKRVEYNFPCLLLSDEIGGATLQSLRLYSCAFHPTTTLGCNKSLTRLYLSFVRITGEELAQFVSNCLALARLAISNCNDIICFKVPCVLQQLSYFQVTYCEMLQVIEISAPNLSHFVYGDNLIQISLGAEVKQISVVGCHQANTISHALAELPSFMPAVERLTVESQCEKVKTPMMPSKILHLKYLDVKLVDSTFYNYDYFCLVSFLDASPVLETFILRVQTCSAQRRDSILRDLDRGRLHLRQMPECRHDNLKNVTITGFSSAKSLIELTRHIIQNASALSLVTLDTARGCGRNAKTGRCLHMTKDGLMGAQKAAEAVRRCIEGIVPSYVNFKALEPCSHCE